MRLAEARYLEPSASNPAETTTRHPWLLPAAAWSQAEAGVCGGWIAPPERAWQLACRGTRRGSPQWSLTTTATAADAARGQATLRAWLVLYPEGESAQTAHRPLYDLFHQLAHRDEHAVASWLQHIDLHYFDFLSPSQPSGKRGRGFEQNVEHFREFGVGLATTHGYYPFWGDYLHPDRERWRAMPGDVSGSAEMSLPRLCQRRNATRAAGSRFGVYLHLVGFDDASPLEPTLRDSVRFQADGRPLPFPWDGPDMLGQAMFMSITSEAWSAHLLEQARWIMELLEPDAIVVDETFAGIGHDYHPQHPGPSSPAMIRFMRDLRALIKSFGRDKALLTSDCGMSAFSLWADGEAGDHAYHAYLGQEAYRQPVGAYASVLGGKPWLPCAWRANTLWPAQLDLARRVGAGVGVGNGWVEYGGLAALPPRRRRRILEDLDQLRDFRRTPSLESHRS